MVSPGDRRVVGVHDAVDEADQKPARDEISLPCDDAFEQRVIGAVSLCDIGIMPRNDMIGELPHSVGVAARRKELEGADADVARRDAGQYGAGQNRLAHHVLARDDGGERARGGDAEREHRLADDVLPQHGAECGAAIAAAGERRWAGPLELDIAADAVGIDDFAEQDGAAIAELRHEMTELVAGIGHRDRVGAVRNAFAREDFGALRARKQLGVEAEMDRQRPVELDQARGGDRGGGDAGEKVRRQRRIGVLEREMDGHDPKIGAAME